MIALSPNLRKYRGGGPQASRLSVPTLPEKHQSWRGTLQGAYDRNCYLVSNCRLCKTSARTREFSDVTKAVPDEALIPLPGPRHQMEIYY